MCHTVLPAPPWRGPAPPCSSPSSGSVAVPLGCLPPPLPPPPPRLYLTPPAPHPRGPRPAPPRWESRFTSETLPSSSASSWCGGRMSQGCLCWICWMEAWRRRMADWGATTGCWQSTSRTFDTVPPSRLLRSYRYTWTLLNYHSLLLRHISL